MSAILARHSSRRSRFPSHVDQITRTQRSEDGDARRHRERQNEHDDDQPGAPIQIVSRLQDACRSGGNHAQQDKSQGYAWRGEIVRHQAVFLAAPRPGMWANPTAWACSEATPAVSHLSDGRQS